MRLRFYLSILGLVFQVTTPCHLMAHTGQVATRDGHYFSGQIRLNSNVVVIANVEQAYIARVALTNLQDIHIQSKPASVVENRFSQPGQASIDWLPSNIGPSYRPGHVEYVGKQVRLRSSGARLGGRRDAFFFLHTPWTGNADIAARILQLHPGSASTRAGLMIRQSLAEDAPNVFLGFTPRQGILQSRLQSGSSTSSQQKPGLYRWLRLRRQENQVTCYTSANGRTWRTLQQLNIALDETVQIGLALSGFDPMYSPGKDPSHHRDSFCSMYDLRAGNSLRFHSFTPRLALSSGSVVTGEITAANHRSIIYASPSGMAALPQQHLSRIDFYWLPLRYSSGTRFSQEGVLLTSGEFFEGEFRGLKNGMATISSVLFGLKKFDVNSEVISIVLNQSSPQPASSEFQIGTWNGSTWHGRILSLDQGGLLLREGTLGRRHIPYHELKNVRRL